MMPRKKLIEVALPLDTLASAAPSATPSGGCDFRPCSSASRCLRLASLLPGRRACEPRGHLRESRMRGKQEHLAENHSLACGR
jgi:hypothetical protein